MAADQNDRRGTGRGRPQLSWARVEKTMVLIPGPRRGLTPSLKTLLRRGSALEPEIGHMKTDGRLNRCQLKGIVSLRREPS